MKADQSNHSVKVIDQTKRFIAYHFGDTSEGLEGRRSEDTASQAANYRKRGINIFLVKKIYRLESIRGKRFL